MFTDNPTTQKNYRKISETKKNKIWNSQTCTDCGKPCPSPITGYQMRGLQLIGDNEQICKKCLKERKEIAISALRAMANGEV